MENVKSANSTAPQAGGTMQILNATDPTTILGQAVDVFTSLDNYMGE